MGKGNILNLKVSVLNENEQNKRWLENGKKIKVIQINENVQKRGVRKKKKRKKRIMK